MTRPIYGTERVAVLAPDRIELSHDVIDLSGHRSTLTRVVRVVPNELHGLFVGQSLSYSRAREIGRIAA